MTTITVSDEIRNENNLLYTQTNLSEVFKSADCKVKMENIDSRVRLSVSCPDCYSEIIKTEMADKLSETIVVNYKYQFFKENIKINGLNKDENEILMASLISADFVEDKKYVFNVLKNMENTAVDGVFNFRLKSLKKKWEEIVDFMPSTFINSQLKDFVTYLIENKKKRVYVDGGKVYDSHFRRLKRCSLLGGENLQVIREILLSDCGEVELSGKIPEDDEFFLKEFYGDKIFFSGGYFS